MRFSSSNGRGNSFSRGRKGKGGNQARRALKSRRVEQLEPRQMLTVTMNPINNVQLPGGQVTYVPLTGIDSSNGPITYTFNTTDPNVTLSLQSTTSKTLVLNVSGTDNTGTAFTGTLELHLFEDLAPQTTAHIESLVSSGFYTGKDFFRVIDGFVAQNNGSSGTNISVEPSAEAPFTSPGLLSLANNGSTGDAQFFVTAIDKAGSTTPIPLAEMPQFLQQGSNHFTVFGQLVSGFDTFEKIMSTTVQANPNFGGEVSSPTHEIKITSASLITDTQNAVLKITAPASFDGNSAIITVTATGSGGATTQKVFTTSVVVDPPQMAPVANQTTTATTPVTFTLQSRLNDQNSGAVYRIFDANTLSDPTNATVSIIQSTGQVTITPNPGFMGTLNLLAGVRSGSASDIPVNYDTQAFTLTVTANPAIKPTLGAVGNQTTAVGAGDSFTLTSTDNGANGVVYKVADASTFSTPANATVSVTPAGLVTITPKAGFSGTINLVAGVRSASDPETQASYATKTFTLTVLAPILGSVGTQTIAQDTDDSFMLNATDTVGHGLAYKIVDATTLVEPTQVTTSVGDLGNVQLIPDAGFTGTLHLLAEVRSVDTPDVQANYVTQAFTLNVVAPIQGTTQKTAEGAPITITVVPNQPGGDVAYNIFDGTTFTAPLHVTIQSIDNTTGQVVLKPEAGFTGLISLRAGVRAANADPAVEGSYDFQPFMLQVDPPGLGSVAAQTVAVGATDTFTLNGNDPSGQGLTYKIVDSTTMQPSAHITATVDTGGHVTIVPDAGFTGTLNLIAEVRSTPSDDVQSNYVPQPFSLTIVAPTLDTVANQTTDSNTAKTVQLAGHDTLGNPLVYKSFTTGVTNVDVSVNSSTGAVTLTPHAGTTGPVTIQVGVRDSTSPDVAANYTMQSFTLTVTAPPVPGAPTGLAVDSSSNTGPFDGNGYVTTDTPTLTVTAQTGSTVQFKLNGTVIATGTETSAGSGIFTATIPAGKLAIGSNTITATAGGTGGTSADSTALTVIYAPDFTTGVYVVPGAPGSSQQVTIAVPHVNAAFKDEIGYFIADSADGSIGGVAPGSAGYAKAALSSSTRHIIFAHGKKAGTSDTVTLSGGQFLVFYMIQNDTTADFLAKNPTDAKGKGPVAFFSVQGANPDAKKHTQIVADPTTGRVQYNWEDLMNQGDSDFNDAVMTVRLASQANHDPSTLHAPGTGSTSVTLTGTLGGGHQSTAPGDIGVFFTDDPDGTIGTLKPGDSGYAAAALAANNFQVLFAAGTAKGTTQSIDVPAGQYLGFYVISTGTTADFLTANPTNSSSSGATAMFSFGAANANGLSHFRWFTPGQQKTDPSQMQLHIMDHLFGKQGEFDDLTANLSFVAGSAS